MDVDRLRSKGGLTILGEERSVWRVRREVVTDEMRGAHATWLSARTYAYFQRDLPLSLDYTTTRNSGVSLTALEPRHFDFIPRGWTCACLKCTHITLGPYMQICATTEGEGAAPPRARHPAQEPPRIKSLLIKESRYHLVVVGGFFLFVVPKPNSNQPCDPAVG